jgi:hypothetical protein
MEFTHDKFGKCTLVDLTQGQMEKLHTEIRALNEVDNVSMTVYRGNMVRACAKLDLMTEPDWKLDDVDNANPGHVYWLSECITEWQSEALSLDPLS